MAGTLLGPDQVKKLNETYPQLVAHVRELLGKDHTGLGLMRVHTLVESFDSDEMARIFRIVNFITPREKLALVRAAVYEVLASDPALFVSPKAEEATVLVTDGPVDILVTPTAAKEFRPPQFNLNVNKASDFHGQKPADTPPPTPIVTSTHQSSVAARVEEGNKRMAEQQTKLEAAVAKLREQTAPKVIDIMDVPADANLQDIVDSSDEV